MVWVVLVFVGRGFLTLILQDDVGGLQVQLPTSSGSSGGEGGGGRWVDVPGGAAKGSLLVNCGDYLSLLARSLGAPTPVTSPVHRVRLSHDRDRLSLVFFFYPRFDAPLPSSTTGDDKGYNTLLLADGAVPPLPSSSFGQHLTRKWAGVQTRV